LAVFVILFLVHLLFSSSFLVRYFFVPIWVLVSIVRSIIRCFSHILPAFLLLLLLSSNYSFVKLLFRLSSSVFLHCHRMCSSVSAAKRTVWVQGSFNFVTVCGPTVNSSQSGYRHLIAPFQPLSVILPTHVLLSLFHYILCAISVLIHLLKSSGWYFSSFEIDSSRARFASSFLLFLPSLTRRCRSLCGRCIFRLPVLRIRRGTFRLAFVFSFYRETNPFPSSVYHGILV
jgi:hypothetical protein